ncbi:MAG: hypothetical protein RIS43_855, partial [Actinomycetota bacterium]
MTTFNPPPRALEDIPTNKYAKEAPWRYILRHTTIW